MCKPHREMNSFCFDRAFSRQGERVSAMNHVEDADDSIPPQKRTTVESSWQFAKIHKQNGIFGIESIENAMELEFLLLLFDVFSIYSARMSWDFVETCTTEIKRLAFSRKTGTRKFILLLLPSLELERE